MNNFKKIYQMEIWYLKRQVYCQYRYLVREEGLPEEYGYDSGYIPDCSLSERFCNLFEESRLPAKIFPVLCDWFNRAFIK